MAPLFPLLPLTTGLPYRSSTTSVRAYMVANLTGSTPQINNPVQQRTNNTRPTKEEEDDNILYIADDTTRINSRRI